MQETYDVIFELASVMLAVPASSAGCEWVFSKVTLVKNELRSAIVDERLNSLMLMSGVSTFLEWGSNMHTPVAVLQDNQIEFL